MMPEEGQIGLKLMNCERQLLLKYHHLFGELKEDPWNTSCTPIRLSRNSRLQAGYSKLHRSFLFIFMEFSVCNPCLSSAYESNFYETLLLSIHPLYERVLRRIFKLTTGSLRCKIKRKKHVLAGA